METSPQFELDRFRAGFDLSALCERAWRDGAWDPADLEGALALADQRCADPSLLFFRREADRQSRLARELGLSLLRLAHLGDPLADPFLEPLLREAPLWLAGNPFARREAFGFRASPFAAALCERLPLSESRKIPWESFFAEARSRRAPLADLSALCESAFLLSERGCLSSRSALLALASGPACPIAQSAWERCALSRSCPAPAESASESSGKSGSRGL